MLSTVCLCKGDRSAITEATRGIESYLYAVHCYDGVLGIWRHDRKGTWREGAPGFWDACTTAQEAGEARTR